MSVANLRDIAAELADLKIKSVMTLVPITIDEDAQITAARKIFRDHNIRHLPVVHRGKLTGILSDRDTQVISLLPDISKMAVADIMTRHPSTVAEDMPVFEAISHMAKHKHGCILVTGHEGDIRGIFTTQDALRLLLGEMGLNVPAPTAYPMIEDDDEA